MKTYKITASASIEAVSTREAIQLFIEESELANWDELTCTKNEELRSE